MSLDHYTKLPEVRLYNPTSGSFYFSGVNTSASLFLWVIKS